ncbi:MAG: MBL fold metallo-hydrolase [Desulfurivibrionaceae bacterium]
MREPYLIVHRATNQIGGNCIEIVSAGGERIILDVGRPLDAPNAATNLLPKSLNLDKPVAGILISHPHQDHYGLLDETPAHWPVYAGRATRDLMRLTANLLGTAPVRDYRLWEDKKSMEIGPFLVTPYLTDHSAFDAYMLLIEVAGKRIFYSGDFRIHGRKAALVQRFMKDPPPNIDLLLMEGTNLGTDKPSKSETELEEDFVELFRKTSGRVFVCWSAQNIDRTVTLYRACLKSGRTLAVDLYTAEVLELLADIGHLPRAGWNNLKVVITRTFSRLYKLKGRDDFVERMAAHGISARQLTEKTNKWVIMVRPSLMRDLIPKGVTPTSDDAWSYSQWRGYLKHADGIALKSWFEKGGARAVHLHTSGHASITDLKVFATAIKPKILIPIHGVSWESGAEGFPPIVWLHDGEPLII